MTKKELSEKANSLPLSPGVYIMRDRTGCVIYVGKSKSLKNRVSQYFHHSAAHSPKTVKMVSNVFDFDVILTKTEFEALVLECSLIKRHRPKYNILLKDDKGYPYIRFSLNLRFPRMSVASKPADDGASYFGPYGGRSAAFAVINTLSEAFKLPTCNRVFPRDIGKARPCLNSHLGKCMAPCSGLIGEEEYRAACRQAAMLLDGKYEDLADKIEKEMLEASDKMLFERAAVLRDKMKAILKLGKNQSVTSGAFADTDVIAFKSGQVKSCVTILHYIKGVLLDKEYEIFENCAEQDASEVLSSFITQYYKRRMAVPGRIFVSQMPEDAESLEFLLKQISEKTVKLEAPQRGEKRRLVELAAQNAENEAQRAETAAQRIVKTLAVLADMLDLPAIPDRIEAYDISNTAGSDIVGGMIVIEKGRQKRSEYRRFKIENYADQNDVGCMAEVLERRIARYKERDPKFAVLPDLILLDGGLGQINAVRGTLQKLGVDIPVFGMVKNDKHRTDELIDAGGNRYGIGATPVIFSFIGNIQEEVHRYSIEYHRSLRAKHGYSSALDKIEGIGKIRKQAMLNEFKTITNIKNATIEQLSAVVPENIAKKIKEKLM